jgi:high-affinity K+ transport system ATPase subunit B
LSAIGIAGMDRMIQANVIATSGRAVEAAGDVTFCYSTKPVRSLWVIDRPSS